ncbi:MAG: hypothetical protein JWM89_1319 [Acidimicrobiales bacterium]|nr:hypothetical protein [Acidimicrobiales bacterium]
MTPRILTDPQRAAAASPEPRLLIEASPGSGKTTVVAERYGLLRFGPSRATVSPVVAMSFTRSATSELRTRVSRRWGAAAISWPHRVETIDTLLRRLLQFLLRRSLLAWPGGHLELEVIDDWHGYSGFRPLEVDDWCRFMEVRDDGRIRTTTRKLTTKRWGFSLAGKINPLISTGITSPREIREVLEDAFRFPAIQAATKAYLGSSMGHLLVDEVFDANQLDLRIIKAACLAGVEVTLVGDPWQALYGWRGARPELVDPFAEDNGFTRASLEDSFRFESADTQAIASGLRAGLPVPVHNAVAYDVALARKWRYLWALPPRIMPLSFGRPQNQTRAATALLLNQATLGRLGCEAMFVREAVGILGLDPDLLALEGPTLLGPLVEQLESGVAEDVVLDQLRDVMVELGASQRPPAIAANEEGHRTDLRDLAGRLREADVVPGLTVFQAKGLEWTSVAVHLTAADRTSLQGGLSQDSDDHRVLYVALTRARQVTGCL